MNSGTGRCLQHLAIRILAVGGDAEVHRADVLLVLGHEQILDLCAAAEHDEQKPGGERIERAAMADFLGAEAATDDGDDVVGRHARGFVDEENTVKIR